MLTWTAATALCLVAFAAIHLLCGLSVFRWRAAPSDPLPANFAPRVAVLLPIRGCDPSLPACVRGVLDQEYPNYEIHLIIDPTVAQTTALREVIRASAGGAPPVHHHELQNPPTACSLKCAALAQAARTLRGIDVVATLDADVAPHPQWLATLVAPLANPDVGAVTGNHWFEPARANPGSLLRSLWNAGSLIPTTFFANPWGGTLAFRWTDLQAGRWIECWERSAVDDGPVRRLMAADGKRIEFVPSLVMLNRESCSFSFFWRYVTRMLTWSRWYERSFFFTVVHALVNGSLWGLVAGLGIAALANGEWLDAGLASVGLGLHATGLWGAYLVVRAGVRRMSAARGELLPRLPFAVGLLAWLGTPAAFLLHLAAVARAGWSHEVEWRGVRYRIRGPHQIERCVSSLLREPRDTEPASEFSL